MFSKSSKPQNRIDSLIGTTTRIEGNVIFSGGLRVDGMIRGNVSAVADQPGTLAVSADARIDGEVQASHIVVNGTIHGPVHATETLELQAGSKVKGDVYYKSIEIHQGAVVEDQRVHAAERMLPVGVGELSAEGIDDHSAGVLTGLVVEVGGVDQACAVDPRYRVPVDVRSAGTVRVHTAVLPAACVLCVAFERATRS